MAWPSCSGWRSVPSSLPLDPAAEPSFWLFNYFPQILARDRLQMPPLAALCEQLGAHATPLPVPHDCSDGFLGAYWRSPRQYLDAGARSAISGFSLLHERRAVRRVAAAGRGPSLRAPGTRRYGYLLDVEAMDIGYRLVVGPLR